jgi:hypothetical protein
LWRWHGCRQRVLQGGCGWLLEAQCAILLRHLDKN